MEPAVTGNDTARIINKTGPSSTGNGGNNLCMLIDEEHFPYKGCKACNLWIKYEKFIIYSPKLLIKSHVVTD